MQTLTLRTPSVFARSTRRAARSARVQPRVNAMLGGGSDEDGDSQKKKRFITREEEPEEYWRTPYEADGASTMKDPLALIGVFAILFPFLFVAIGIATGAIDTTGGR